MQFEHDVQRETHARVEDYLPDFFEDPFHDQENGHFYVRYGSTVLEISVDAYGPQEAVVKITSYCVQNAEISAKLTAELLALNHDLAFGAFSMIGRDVFFSHSIFGRDMNARRLLDAIAAVANVADEYDDLLAAKYGGTTALERIQQTGGRSQRRQQQDDDLESTLPS
ncbi:MAG: hypothetical protein AAF604_24020 [Acidobacteriota bacterium]